jgi:uncharacterized protein
MESLQTRKYFYRLYYANIFRQFNSSMKKSVKKWIKNLDLKKHPEGGWYKEVYRSSEIILKQNLPDRFKGDRSFATSIYFLLTSDEFSAFHRINQDEIWHFYDGAPLTIHIIDKEGNCFEQVLGKQIEEGENLQIVVNAGCFFAASVNEENSFTLVGCTVAPGFDFDDFEMPAREELLNKFPQHEAIIKRLTQ